MILMELFLLREKVMEKKLFLGEDKWVRQNTRDVDSTFSEAFVQNTKSGILLSVLDVRLYICQDEIAVVFEF